MKFDKEADEAKKRAEEAIKKAQEAKTLSSEIQMIEQRIQQFEQKRRKINNPKEAEKCLKMMEHLGKEKTRKSERLHKLMH